MRREKGGGGVHEASKDVTYNVLETKLNLNLNAQTLEKLNESRKTMIVDLAKGLLKEMEQIMSGSVEKTEALEQITEALEQMEKIRNDENKICNDDDEEKDTEPEEEPSESNFFYKLRTAKAEDYHDYHKFHQAINMLFKECQKMRNSKGFLEMSMEKGVSETDAYNNLGISRHQLLESTQLTDYHRVQEMKIVDVTTTHVYFRLQPADTVRYPKA